VPIFVNVVNVVNVNVNVNQGSALKVQNIKIKLLLNVKISTTCSETAGLDENVKKSK
jgi:hypothetical protein